MTHDPLCPCESHKQPHIQHLNGVCHYCQCELIAKVRKHERLAARYDVARVIVEVVEGKRELNPAFFDAIYAAAGGTVAAEQEQP